LVVGLATGTGNDLLTFAVDTQHLNAQMGVDAVAAVVVGIAHGQRLGVATAEVFGQVHAVIGALALFAEHMQLVAGEGAALDQLFDAVVTDHAVADDDQFFVRERSDGRTHGLSSVELLRHWAGKTQKGAWSWYQLQAPVPGN